MQPSFNPVFNSLVYSPYSKRGYFPGNGSLTDTQLLAAIDPDQMLLIDSTPHYTTAHGAATWSWPALGIAAFVGLLSREQDKYVRSFFAKIMKAITEKP